MDILFFIFSAFAGLISFAISYIFVRIEQAKKTLLPGKQLCIQVLIFIGFWYVGKMYFLETQFFGLSWIWGFIIIETVAGFLFQSMYEYATGKKLFNM